MLSLNIFVKHLVVLSSNMPFKMCFFIRVFVIQSVVRFFLSSGEKKYNLIQAEALKLIKEERERKSTMSLSATQFFFQTNSALLIKKLVMWQVSGEEGVF